MDFDDLEAEAESRIAAGEEVQGFARENNQPPRGTILELMKRGGRVPKDKSLPEKSRKMLPPWSEPLKEREPKLRLLAFYGAGDQLAAGWAAWAHECPPDIEMATYEWPGHGVREEEDLRKTLDSLRDDAFEGFKDVMDTGHFAVLGHSIGCLLATAVCEKAERELNVKPNFAIMLERAPPDIGVLSPKGVELLTNDPKGFCDLYAGPFIYSIGGQHAVDMWAHDMFLENDNRDRGFYTYPCPVLTVCALKNYFEETIPEEQKTKEYNEVMDIKKAILMRGTTFNFSREQFESWKEWTSEACEVLYVDTDHYGVKQHAKVREKIYSGLKKVMTGW